MTEWATAVARRAGVEPTYAEQVLEQYHVRPTAALPSPRRLVVSRIRFSGEKLLDGQREHFDFDFTMGAGVWCVATDGENFAGKSSVLEILLWALRGRSHLQSDVQKWLHRVELSGAIDQDEFAVVYDVQNGIPQGELILAKPQRHAIAGFKSGSEFEEVMHEFMLNRLGLIPTPFWQGKSGDQDGTPSNVSWAGYSQALYIPNGSHQALLGDEFMGGQAGKLLQVFIGLPWAHTHAAAQVAAKARKQFLRNSIRRRNEDAKARASEITKLEMQLDDARRTLEALPHEGALLKQLDQALEEAGKAAALLSQSRTLLQHAALAVTEAQSAATVDRQRLLDLRESTLGHAFFHTLDPKFCPRCEHSVDQARRVREQTTAECALCGNDVSNLEDDGSELSEAEERVRASTAAERDMINRAEALKETVDAAERRYHEARARADHLLGQRESYTRRRQLELQVARLEGMLEERSQPISSPESVVEDDPEWRILHFAEVEAQHRTDAAKARFFEDLNSEVLRLAKAFGIHALEAVEIDRAAHMRLIKGGGASTSFSRATDGERLRLKIAVVIALLRLGKKSGIGRHPGLLLIDSPGAQEEADKDFTKEIEELTRVAEELQEVQILLASARSSLVERVLPADHMRIAPRGKKLW